MVPEDARVVSGLRLASFRLWFPIFRSISAHVPPEFLARLASPTVERAVWSRESVRQAICENMAQVLGLPAGHRRVRDAGLEMLAHHSRLWIDFLRYTSRPLADPAVLVSLRVGDEQFLEAQRQGKGAIVLTAHVGNFELGGLFLRHLGLEVHTVYATDPSPVVEQHRQEARNLIGVKGIRVTNSPFAFLPILTALKRNAFVAIQGDRDISGTGRRFPFFGKTASFPMGPFLLSALSGAPIFPVFVLRREDGRYATIVEPGLRVESDAPAVVERAMSSFVATLERTIREHASQWYLFTRFWE